MKNEVIYKKDAIKTVSLEIAIKFCVSSNDAREIATHALSALPLVEVVQSEWIEKNSHTYICSNCGFEQPIYGNLYEYNFCPRCMARMKGGENKWQR